MAAHPESPNGIWQRAGYTVERDGAKRRIYNHAGAMVLDCAGYDGEMEFIRQSGLAETPVMHRNSPPESHIPSWSHLRPLICPCCGGLTRGRQWANQDAGYGICESCVVTVGKKMSACEFERIYGKAGINHSIHGALNG